MQKTVNEDFLIYSNTALVVKTFESSFLSKVASWKHVTVLKMDSIASTLTGVWPQVQNRYICCRKRVTMAASMYMTKR